ncbi:MAG: hypothetical protein M1830_009559 [Pleopsidium flavum]|nr:MAG: hypothetical protein M1830_009559 [Pleopsidium flavum]
MDERLFKEEARVFSYKETWAEANSDPRLIFHTSGTSGLPRPIEYTNWMMTLFDAAELMPDTDQETMNDHFQNSRCHVALPHLHFVGMTLALQWTTFLNTVLVVGPPDAATAVQVIQILDPGNFAGVVLPASLIEDVCRHPQGVNGLSSMEYVYFVGAPLLQLIAEQLVGHCKVQPAMGSTEAAAYFI